MESTSFTLITTLGILLLLSAFFSATETAYTSFNRIRMKNTAQNGNKKAELVLNLAANFDQLLSTVLIGNNIVNITAASLATVIFVAYFGDAGVTIASIVMTILVLIFGEISPKSLAKEFPESFAMAVAPILRILVILFAPLNFIFFQWKRWLSKIIGGTEEKGITEEELLTIVEEAEQEGSINEQEGSLIRSALEFNDLEAIDIFTPRIDVAVISEMDSKEDIAKVFRETGYSRLPIYRDTVDNIIGVIHHKDFFNYVYNTEKLISTVIKPAVYITPTIKISKLLKLLQQNKSHMAVVIDEYGGTMGILTLEDILEELVGEIWDEHDEVVEVMEKVAENTFKVLGSANLDKLFNFLQIDAQADSTTIGGWVIEQFGRLPEEGETFDFQKMTVTVLKLDARRIHEIMIERWDDQDVVQLQETEQPQ